MAIDVRDLVINLKIIGAVLRLGATLIIKGSRFDPDSGDNPIDRLRALCLERGVQAALNNDFKTLSQLRLMETLHRLESMRRDLRHLHARHVART